MSDKNDKQHILNELKNIQAELEGVVISHSKKIEVVQTEAQALFLVQAALQAAIEASVVTLGQNNKDVEALQKISQSLHNVQLQKQKVFIFDSEEVKVTQTELQLEAVVQAAIQILARITLKVGLV